MLDILNELGLILQIIGFYFLITSLLYLYKFFTTKDAVKDWYKMKLRTALAILIIGGIASFLLYSFIRNNIGISQGGGVPVPAVPLMVTGASAPSRTSYGAPTPTVYRETNYPTQPSDPNISDTREYIKQTYSASIKTRSVEEIAKKVELLIRGVDGRIDSSNISEESAYISFVIPKKELSRFELDIRTYIPEKFYSQSISSQNLLSDKQALEQKQDTNVQALSTLAKQKKDTEDVYAKDSALIKTQLKSAQSALSSITVEIARKEGEINATTNPQVKTILQVELNALLENEQRITNQINSLNSSLSSLTKTFTGEMTRLGVSVTEQTTVLASLDKQETNFFDNVETVRGTVSIQYISLWKILKLYSPINPILILGLILILFNFYSTNKKEKSLMVV